MGNSHPITDAFFTSRSPADIAYLMHDLPGFFWLDGETHTADSDSWSYLGWKPLRRFRFHAQDTGIRHPDYPPNLYFRKILKMLKQSANPVSESMLHDSSLPAFTGGWVGFMGYNASAKRAAKTTQKPISATPMYGTPDASWGLFSTILAYSHRRSSWWVCDLGFTENLRLPHIPIDIIAKRVVDFVVNHVQNERLKVTLLDSRPTTGSFCNRRSASPTALFVHSNMNFESYERKIRKALSFISDGDCYQLNIAQCFRAQWLQDSYTFFERLRTRSPAEYGVYLSPSFMGKGRALCSVSPELFLHVRGDRVITRPIKGTRPLVPGDEARNLAAAAELDSSAKERSELAMIIDLERNDLGRVCQYGSVRVVSPGHIERLPTLIHRVAEIEGRLKRPGLMGWPALLRATFPGGSITGAPKKRAMEIIAELEPTPRGPYCGCAGWIGLNGDADLNILIRTAVVDERVGEVSYHAGGGIVAESDPAAEYAETLHKARAFFSAVGGTFHPDPVSEAPEFTDECPQ